MDRAAKAVRRSGIKLLSLGGGHGDLNMVLSEQKDAKNTAKAFMAAQNSAAQYLMKWAANENNRAVQDVSNQIVELNLVWTEAQREFTENLKEFKQTFELILEGEKHVDHAKNNLITCEQREAKIKKELKKAAKHKAAAEDLRILEHRLIQAERQKDLAIIEVEDRIRENEAVKLMRFKEGICKLSSAYVELGRRCSIIFGAQRDIANHLPDVHAYDMEDLKYTGAGATKHYVLQAKERIRQLKRQGRSTDYPLSEPPPPYSQEDFLKYPISADTRSDSCDAEEFQYSKVKPDLTLAMEYDKEAQEVPQQVTPPPQYEKDLSRMNSSDCRDNQESPPLVDSNSGSIAFGPGRREGNHFWHHHLAQPLPRRATHEHDHLDLATFPPLVEKTKILGKPASVNIESIHSRQPSVKKKHSAEPCFDVDHPDDLHLSLGLNKASNITKQNPQTGNTLEQSLGKGIQIPNHVHADMPSCDFAVATHIEENKTSISDTVLIRQTIEPARTDSHNTILASVDPHVLVDSVPGTADGSATDFNDGNDTCHHGDSTYHGDDTYPSYREQVDEGNESFDSSESALIKDLNGALGGLSN